MINASYGVSGLRWPPSYDPHIAPAQRQVPHEAETHVGGEGNPGAETPARRDDMVRHAPAAIDPTRIAGSRVDAFA